MTSEAVGKPHAVCVPFPVQGHINAMLKLAKLLHSKGFHITFVHTEFNYRRILRTRGPDSLRGLDGFRLETITDGLPDVDPRNDVGSFLTSVRNNCSGPLTSLVERINERSSAAPPVTCIVFDGMATFALAVAAEFSVPGVLFWPASAASFICFLRCQHLIQTGLLPIKGESDEYLDTPIVDWIPGMAKTVRLRDLPRTFLTTDINNARLQFAKDEVQQWFNATAIILNTFDELEGPAIDAMSSMLPLPIYAVGPLSALPLRRSLVSCSIGANLWAEDSGCLEWLDGREDGSVVYVNFGSLAVTTTERLIELAWGLTKSTHPFLWVIRPDIVMGSDSAPALPEELLAEMSGRSLLVRWAPQEEVLSHRAIGGFLTHCGWNSTTESICCGVPMLCWPFDSEQPTNCRYICDEWGIGVEIRADARRGDVEVLIRELMEGEKGKEMRRCAVEWMERATQATESGGTSSVNLDRAVQELLCPNKIA